MHMEDSDEDYSDDDEAGLLQEAPVPEKVRKQNKNPFMTRKNTIRARRSCCSCLLLVGGIFAIIDGVKDHNIALFTVGFFLLCCPCMLLCYTCTDFFCEYYGGACLERIFVIFATVQHHRSGAG